MVVAAVLLALLLATALSVWQPAVWAVGVVLATGVAWWMVNGPVEGEVLVELAPGRGITVADLLVPPLVAVAALALANERRRPREPRQRQRHRSPGPAASAPRR